MTSLEKIQKQIDQALKKSGRSQDSVRLIAVSKRQSIEKIQALWQEGQLDFGENYVQEWFTKVKSLSAYPVAATKPIYWHFIGHLQSNKVKEIVGKVEYIHSVDRLKIAERISQSAEAQNVIQKILLQVNLANEPNKSGFSEKELLQNLPQLAQLSHIQLVGLMAIPPVSENLEVTRPYFKLLKSLLEKCNHAEVLSQNMTELSMGMSQDFIVALEEGATMIRLGTILFGPRE